MRNTEGTFFSTACLVLKERGSCGQDVLRLKLAGNSASQCPVGTCGRGAGELRSSTSILTVHVDIDSVVHRVQAKFATVVDQQATGLIF